MVVVAAAVAWAIAGIQARARMTEKAAPIQTLCRPRPVRLNGRTWTLVRDLP